jgi:cytochrome c oxidase subunit IV
LVSTTFNKRLLIVWAILTSMTLAYVWLDEAVDQNGTLKASTVVTVSAIVIALIKVRIIFREFMEVRHAPALLCRLTDGWVVLIGVCLLGSYFVGSAIAG